MSDNDQNSIGLAEFIQQVKQDLLTVAPGKDKDVPILFVESVELELQVTAKRTGKVGTKGSVKINVLGTGGEFGGEVGGDISNDRVHKVTVKLSPLFDQSRLQEFYETLHSDQIPTAIRNSLTALFKGNEEGNLIEELGE